MAAQAEDIDAFVFLPASASGLVALTPVYDALTALGGRSNVNTFVSETGLSKY
ncbi:MAG: hypothetical protein ABI147_13990 [Acidobacteriaceae bacterium]